MTLTSDDANGIVGAATPPSLVGLDDDPFHDPWAPLHGKGGRGRVVPSNRSNTVCRESCGPFQRHQRVLGFSRISNYFSFALMTEIFWFKTERVMSWKVPATRMALPVIMLVHAMFERWELRNGFAGFGPPATAEMLAIGLHVLPAVCAGILSSLLATYIQASRIKSFLASQGTQQ